MNLKFKFDLGLRNLLPEWRSLFSLNFLKEDIFAGMSVAFVAIPLSLAIALASGVPPSVGLLTAIVGSIVCALFGGTPLAVSGPAAAMSVLIADVVYESGFEGLLVVCLSAGIMQIISGVVRLGQMIRYMPYPVIAGFTAGIGAIILIGQLPRVLGIEATTDTYVLKVFLHVMKQVHNIDLATLFTVICTVGIIFILPRFFSRIPAVVIAVIVPTVAVHYLKIPLETIGKIPSSLPLPQLPHLPKEGLWDLLGTAFVVYLLASVETLLSSSAVDKISRSRGHDPNQELIGQGLGNVAVSFFGGIPVTGVIARSALNVQAGAKTRRAAIFHAIVLIAAIYLISPQISEIPIAVLAGVLVSVALRMLNPTELVILWRTDKAEALVFLGTFMTIVSFDLINGIKTGILIAMAAGLFRLSRTHAHIRQPSTVGPAAISLQGSITFLSANKLSQIRKKVLRKDLSRGLIFDFAGVTFIDSSGAALVLNYLNQLVENKITFSLKNLSPAVTEILTPLDEDHILNKHLICDDNELQQFFPDHKIYSMVKLVDGAHKFKLESKRNNKAKLTELAKGQVPHTLLIACSDSRVNTHLMVNADLGEVFTIRNVGNMIPVYGTDSLPAEGAAIEYALGILHVDHIIVCGHSYCGAMTAVLENNPSLNIYPNLKSWLDVASAAKNNLPEDASVEDIIKLNILMQMENIKSYPIVQEKLKSGEVELHGWYYDISTGGLKEWDETQQLFALMGTNVQRQLKNLEDNKLNRDNP
ncbi:MAG: bifunctional SulP family inorganic anion transporter/carbonic anhydrase [Gammaproteobacteria bacterium]|nr:bifunctional SulP family inorganic anion transporter/carbonic anhydrase [Gammaproteobacteria bacterium]